MIVIASDHAGLELKRHLVEVLRSDGHEVRDLGPDDAASVDYPDYAHRVASEVAAGRTATGILVCGTGLGMSMAANRHAGVRAAVCTDAYTAEMARRHNDANVLCVGGRVLGTGVAEQVARVFVATPFDGGRHQRRATKIERAEEEQP
jgi:ribose 5-phosphate isomerase B